VLDQIRGRTYEEALILLEYLPFRACEPVLDTLISVGLPLCRSWTRFVDPCCIVLDQLHWQGPWSGGVDHQAAHGHHVGGRQRQEQFGHAQSQAVRQRVHGGRRAGPEAHSATRQGQVRLGALLAFLASSAPVASHDLGKARRTLRS
jgi:hypothetical protein